MNRFKIELSIESRLDQVCLLRTAVRAIAAELGFDQGTCAEIELGVAEAVNNVIEHSYKFDLDRRIDVEIDSGADCLGLSITDDGAPLPLDYLARCLAGSAPSQELDIGGLSERGRGLWIIGQTMDSVSFDRDGERNHLHLSKKLPAPLSHSAG